MVERDPVGAVEALGEDGDRLERHIVFQDAVVRGVGDEELGPVGAEGEAVGAERREAVAARREQVVRHEGRRAPPAGRAILNTLPAKESET